MPKTLEDLLAAQPQPVVSWYAITAEATSDDAPTRAKVRIYDAIGGWWGTNAADFVAELDALDVDELDVHVNSPGGAVWDGIAIMNSLRKHRARVTVIVDGLAASAASIVAMAGDEVVMAEGSQMMVHQASGGAWGNADFMRDSAAILDKIDQNLAGIYARRAGGSRESWLDVMRAETWYNADEAVAAGLADRADAAADPVDAEAAFDLSRFTYAGRSHAPAPRRPAASLRPVAMAPGAHEAGFAADLPKTPVSTEPGKYNGKENPVDHAEFLSGLRTRLGVSAEADEATILAAFDEALAEQADAPTVLPEGVVAIDSAVLDELKADAAAGRQALDAQTSARRDQLVDAALADGRVAPANRAVWRERLDKDEEGTVALLGTLATNKAVPVDPIGYTGGQDESSEDALYASLYPNSQKES